MAYRLYTVCFWAADEGQRDGCTVTVRGNTRNSAAKCARYRHPGGEVRWIRPATDLERAAYEAKIRAAYEARIQ